MRRLFLGAIAALAAAFGASAGKATPAADGAFEATVAARDRFWSAVGTPEEDVLAHLVSPGLTGGPAWPTLRQAYRVIRRDGSVVVATDGMSDPFEDGESPGNGFGMELFLETADIPPELAGQKGDISRITESWAFALLKQVADTVADAGGIVALLDEHEVLSLEFPGASGSPAVSGQLPARFVTGDDSVGVLVGGPDPDFSVEIEDAPLSSIRLVPVVLITGAELDHLRAGGAAARRDLVARLAGASRHRSELRRESLEGRD